MKKVWHAIYPPTAHFIPRHLSLIGFLSIVIVALGGLYIGIQNIPGADKYLAFVRISAEKIQARFVANVQGENEATLTQEPAEEPQADAAQATATSTEQTTATSSPQEPVPPPQIKAAPRIEPQPGQPRTTIYPATSTTATPVLPNGIPDLEIQVVDSGIILTDGTFAHTTSTGRGEQTGIVFDVKNTGTAVAGPWRFAAELPTTPGNFTSEIQEPLAPGEKIRYTIGFRLLKNQGPNTVTIIVDPSRAVLNETNRGNNSVATTVIRNYP